MSTVLLEDASSQLAQLVQQASSGEEIVLFVRDTEAAAKMVALPTDTPEPRKGGFGSGKYALIYMADDFDAPIDDFDDYM